MNQEPAVDAQIATLSAQMTSVVESVAAIQRDIRADSERHQKDNSEIRRELADLRLKMSEQYATREALDRVEDAARGRHALVMGKLEDIDERVTEVEKAEAGQHGVQVGRAGVLAFAAGLVASCGAAAGVVAAFIH